MRQGTDWPALYARLMAGCGYTPDAIDAMAMADVIALVAHWRDCPPVHETLAAALGLGPKPPRDPADPSGIGALIARQPESHR